jgi:hypothetical protein
MPAVVAPMLVSRGFTVGPSGTTVRTDANLTYTIAARDRHECGPSDWTRGDEAAIAAGSNQLGFSGLFGRTRAASARSHRRLPGGSS